MAIEDLLQQPPWSIESVENVFAVTSDKATWTDMRAGDGDFGDTTAWVAKDLSGAPGLFWGNFRHDLYYKLDRFDGGGYKAHHKLQIYELATPGDHHQGEDDEWYPQAALYADFRKKHTNRSVTINIGSPTVFYHSHSGPGWTMGHELEVGDKVVFSTSGSLPTGLTAGTAYYVIADGLDKHNFRVSSTPGGPAVNTSGSQSGSHTMSTPLLVYFSLGYMFDWFGPTDLYYKTYEIVLGASCYFRFERTDEGTHGSANLKVYSDAARTNLLANLNLPFDRETEQFVLTDPLGNGAYYALYNIENESNKYSSGEVGYIDLRIPQIQSILGAGGFILGGTADMTGEPASPSITGSGGFILGGTAVLKRGAVRQGQGGLVLGGRAAFLSWVVDSAAEQSGQIDPAFWGWRAGGDSIAFWGWSGGMSTAVPYSLIRLKPYFQTTITVPDY